MGCCSLKRDPRGLSWSSLVMVSAPILVLGGPAWAILSAGSRVLPLESPRDSLHCLLGRNIHLVNRRFRHIGLRAVVAGTLLRYWPAGAGLAFKGLYSFGVALAWLVGASAALLLIHVSLQSGGAP